MKTLMQEVYENFNTMSDADFKSWMLNTDLLEEEKRLSIRFAEFWAAEHDHPESYYLDAEEAYNEKYR